MIYSIFSKKDATIYEGTAASGDGNKAYQNTGIDEILEIRKIISSSGTPATYLSRALIYFDIDWTKIKAGSEWDAAAYLNLYAISANSIPMSYTIAAHPISESWNMGLGRAGNTPYNLEQVSWKNRIGKHLNGTLWTTSSYTAGGTGQNGSEVSGGGTWWTGSYGEQTITDENTDLRIDVSKITSDWSSSAAGKLGYYNNSGFIVKLSGSQETDGNRYGETKYFSSETHTIYQPRLEICWSDKIWNTGSLTAITPSTDTFFYLKNNRGAYKKGSKIRFYTLCREKYPTKTYSNTTAALGIYYVPENSVCYSIKDAKTNETIIPFDDTYTKLSCDSTKGNYFEIFSDSLSEERSYKIQLRYTDQSDSSLIEYYDLHDTFKVVR